MRDLYGLAFPEPPVSHECIARVLSPPSLSAENGEKAIDQLPIWSPDKWMSIGSPCIVWAHKDLVERDGERKSDHPYEIMALCCYALEVQPPSLKIINDVLQSEGLSEMPEEEDVEIVRMEELELTEESFLEATAEFWEKAKIIFAPDDLPTCPMEAFLDDKDVMNAIASDTPDFALEKRFQYKMATRWARSLYRAE